MALSGGLQIRVQGLLQASRTVEKLAIDFCNVAKRVNVRKLKTDLWTRLDSSCPEAVLNSKAKSKKVKELKIDENRPPESNFNNLLVTENGLADSDKNANVQLDVTDGKMSFQDLISDISNKQKQQEVTLPFYFICLLHLANEKTLKIEGQSNLADLVISKDT